MKWRLAWEADGPMRVEVRDRRAGHPLHAQPGSLAGIEFFLQVFQRLVRRLEQVTIQSLEIALDLFLENDAFNPINRGAMALRRHPRPVLPVVFLEVVVAIVEGVDNMRRGPARHPTPDWTVVEDNHGAAHARQFIRNRE